MKYLSMFTTMTQGHRLKISESSFKKIPLILEAKLKAELRKGNVL